MPHALVIGGGPAGSLAAILLARGGWRVTVVEQSRFPRDKVCGECMSTLGVDVLTRHGVLCGGIPLRRTVFHARDGAFATIELPRPMMAVSRAVLDSHLLDVARRAGVTILQPARCEALNAATEVADAFGIPNTSATSVAASIRSLGDNTLTIIHAEVALLADGKSALLPDRPAPTGDFGMQAHFVDVDAPADAIELFAVDGHYGGLAPVEGNRHNWSFSVPAGRLPGMELDVLFARIVEENTTLARRMRHARRAGEWNASPLPRFGVQRRWPANVIPVGNTAAAIEPIGGEGIGLALRSAELAAESLLSGSHDPAALRARYVELWGSRRFACRAAAAAMSSPWAGWVVRNMEGNPITRLMLSWMGKTAG